MYLFTSASGNPGIGKVSLSQKGSECLQDKNSLSD